MAATFESSITYGIGLEATAGTEAASYIGIPQESLVKIPYGKRVEHVPRFRGTPYKMHHLDRVACGNDPKPSGFSHNWCFQTLIRLLAAMHQTPGTEDVNVFTLTCPTTGVEVTEDDTQAVEGSYTLSVKEDFGARHAALGCVPSRIQITFPADGGPVKMSYGFSAMDIDDTALEDTMTIQTDDIDLVTSDFQFYLDNPGSGGTTQIYPGGDIVITLEPEIESLRRGQDHVYQHIIGGWGGTFEYVAMADSDPEELHDYWITGARKCLVIVQGDGAESEDGEITMEFNGTITEETGQGSAGILQENATFNLTGDATNVYPYKFVYFDSTMA